jgi:hypothetical protein
MAELGGHRLTGVGIEQHYLFEARQMQALSLAVHIPLVCFGIAFPVLVLFAEYRYLRTGDDLYRVLARRWSRIMLALFAVGVVTGTILSFELGTLWPQWMADFGNVFGLGFALEGFSFFIEAIFMGIYAYGWERLSPRLHFACGIPVAVAGVAGSLFVISVNGWMNHPSGFTVRDGRAVDVHPWQALFGNPLFWSEYVHMYFAAFIVCGFLLAAAYAWAFLRGRRGRYERTALSITLGAASVAAPLQVVVGDWAARDVAGQARGHGGPGHHHEGRRRAPARLVRRARGGMGRGDPPAAVPAGRPQPERGGARPGHRLAGRPAAGERGAPGVPGDGRHRHAAGRHRPGVPVPAPAPPRPAPLAARGGGRGRPAVGGGPHRGVDHHRGRPAAMDRLRRDARVGRRDRRERHPGRVRDPGHRLPHPRRTRGHHLAPPRPGPAASNSARRGRTR